MRSQMDQLRGIRRLKLGQLIELVQQRRALKAGRDIEPVGEGWDPGEIGRREAGPALSGQELVAASVAAFREHHQGGS